MAWPFTRKNKPSDAHYALYNAIVAQSRQPVFFADWGVPDTLTGRFDMISLHVALVLRRLQADGTEHAEFSQGLFDLFFADMDRSLREMGVGDISVPKRIEKMGSMFYGLVEVLAETLPQADNEALEAALARNILPDDANDHAPQLAAYVRSQADALAAAPASELRAGKLGMSVAA